MDAKSFLINLLAQSLNPALDNASNPQPATNLNFDDFGLAFLTQIFAEIIQILNLFSLAFSIFLIYIFLAGFFQHRIFNPRKGQGSVEKKGVGCINRARRTSLRQVGMSVLFALWSVFSFGFFDVVLNLLVIIIFVIKIRFDLVEMLEDMKYFKWLESYRKLLLKALGKK